MKKQEFWVANVSDRVVILNDLAVIIQPFSSVNLLDKRHYKLTADQLNQSLASGSLYKKRDKIVRRLVPPGFQTPKPIPKAPNSYVPDRSRSGIIHKEENYEELQMSDEEYINQSDQQTDPQIDQNNKSKDTK